MTHFLLIVYYGRYPPFLFFLWNTTNECEGRRRWSKVHVLQRPEFIVNRNLSLELQFGSDFLLSITIQEVISVKQNAFTLAKSTVDFPNHRNICQQFQI